MPISKLLSLFCNLLIIFVLAACGGENTTGSAKEDNQSESKQMKAQLGVLANATVNIFRLEANTTKTLLFTEQTSDGATFDEIGNFTAHIDALEDNKFYIYEVVGGIDKDADDDGVIDEISTTNNGKIRLIAKGSDLKDAQMLPKVTLVSEMLYIYAYTDIWHDSVNLEEKLNSYAKEIIVSDIDGNGVINYRDTLFFNPVADKDKLNTTIKFDTIISQIHNNDLAYINRISNKIIGNYNINKDSERYTYYMNDIALSPDGTQAYVVGNMYTPIYGFLSIDISDTANPKLLDNYNINIEGLNEVKISTDGTKAYLASDSKGIKIIDISNPESLKLLSEYETQGYAYDIALSNDNTKAYVATSFGGGLEIIDINISDRPRMLGRVDIPGDPNSITLSKDNSIAYVTSADGLQIINISTPQSPILLGDYNTSGYAVDVVLSDDGNKAYIADGDEGIQIIDVSTPSALKLISSFATKENGKVLSRAQGVALSNDNTIAFIANETDGLKIVDVSTATNPKLLSTIKTSVYALSVILSRDGTIAYVADEAGGLQIIDIGLWSGTLTK